MDGVLARFEEEPNALERFVNERGFFERLQPTKFTEQLQKYTPMELEDFYILTSSPNHKADMDKINWIRKHVPALVNKIICVRSGKEKARFAKGNILIDDYTENLEHWTLAGGLAVKALNAHNGKSKKWKGLTELELRVD